MKRLRLLLLLPLASFAKPDLLAETNNIRTTHHLTPYMESSFMDSIAESECNYRNSHKMNTKLFMSHARPWLTVNERYDSYFSNDNFTVYYWENQAWMSTSVKYATKAFWDSLPHRKNLLDKDFKYMGQYTIGRLACESFSTFSP